MREVHQLFNLGETPRASARQYPIHLGRYSIETEARKMLDPGPGWYLALE